MKIIFIKRLCVIEQAYIRMKIAPAHVHTDPAIYKPKRYMNNNKKKLVKEGKKVGKGGLVFT